MDRGFAAWNSAVAAAVETVGTHDFPRRMEAALETIIDFDILMVFGYDGPGKPVCCYHNIDEHRARTVVDAYVSGPYLLDPFYGAAMDKKIGGLRRLKDMAPDHFYSSEYYKQHYVRTGIRDEIGFVCRPANWAAVVVSFTRPTTAPAFGRRDLASIRDAEPLLRVLGERHWRRDDPASGVPERLSSPQNPINETLNRMTDGILTPREIEITSLILRGALERVDLRKAEDHRGHGEDPPQEHSPEAEHLQPVRALQHVHPGAFLLEVVREKNFD